MKNRFIAFILVVSFLLTIPIGCKGKGEVSDGGESSVDSALSDESIDNTSGVSVDENSSIDENSETGIVSSTSTTGIKTSTTTSSTQKPVASTGIRWGVTNTKKMPNYISKITNKTLRVVTSSSNNDDAADLLAFKALTGLDITIDYEVVGWSTLPERVAAMVLADNAPDLFDYSWLNMVKKTYWDDWTSYIDFEDALWKDTATINNGLGDYDGKRVCLFFPNDIKGSGMSSSLIYNVKLVEEAIDGNPALADPLNMYYDNKWTWDTLYSFVEEITDLDSNIYGISLPDYAVSKFISSTNQDIVNVSNNKILTYNLENANVIRALNFAKKFYKISNVAATWEGGSMLLNNTCGFWDNSSGLSALYSSNAMITAVKNGKIRAVPFPRDPQSDTFFNGNLGGCSVLPTGAKNPWLSAAWMYYRRYKSYNENRDLKVAFKNKFTVEYGWPEDIFALISPKDYSTKFSKLKFVESTTCTAYGERLSDFDQAKYWGMITNPSVLTSTVVETVGPGLKEVIARYNAS